MAETKGAERGTRRFAGFVDAVFAISLTLLITEIKVPGGPGGPSVAGDLFGAVASQWREHLALFLSFLTIGVYWLQHHYSGRIFVRSDYVLGVINLGFLLAVTAVPYSLRLWCYHVGTSLESEASVALATGLFAPSLFWMIQWSYALWDSRLIDDRLTDAFLRHLSWRYGTACAAHAAAMALAFVWPRLAVALAIGLVACFLVPQPSPEYRPGQAPKEDEVLED